MAGFLKVKTLPSNLNYPKLSNIGILTAVSNVGNVISYIDYTKGSINDYLNKKTEVVGNPTTTIDGMTLTANDFVNTNIADMQNFTAIAVVKPHAHGSNILFITSFTHESKNNGVAAGWSASAGGLLYPQGGIKYSAFDAWLPLNTLSIIAITRNNTSFTIAKRVNKTTKAVTVTGDSSISPTPIGFCSSISAVDANAGSISVFAHSAIHNKSLSKSELISYVDALGKELNI